MSATARTDRHAVSDDALKRQFTALGKAARAASRDIARAETGQKNAALFALAENIKDAQGDILDANRADMDTGRNGGLDAALLDRLALNPERVSAMAEGVRQIAALPDPVGAITDLNMRPSGIQVGRMRVPLGVVGIIYESRPNVTADAASLCLKSGNAAILRGGSEALRSNQAIARCIDRALVDAGLPRATVQVLDVTDRRMVGLMVGHPQFIDVIVPRGGKGWSRPSVTAPRCR